MSHQAPKHITEDQLAAMVTSVEQGRGKAGRSLPIKSKRVASYGVSAAPLTLALTGQLCSGKNQVQLLFRHGKVQKYPNKTFTNWRAKAHVQVIEQADWGSRTIITTPVRLTVEYWPGDARTRDVSGQLDALFHLLVFAKVLKDDGLIHELGGWTRHPINKKFPKVLMTIEAVKWRCKNADRDSVSPAV